MVLEISMYFEGTSMVPFPSLIFFSHHTLLFFAILFIEENALNKMRLV